MRAVDVGATVGADGVEIKLPRLRVVVERRQAERLRDALNTVLPAAGGPRTSRYMLVMWDHVDPELSGPFDGERDRTEAAQDFRRAHGDGNSAYRLDVGTDGVFIVPVGDDEVQMPRTSKWVSSKWIDGRNATVHLNTSTAMFEVSAYEKRGDVPRLAHVATFVFEGGAEYAADQWTRLGRWDADRHATDEPKPRTPVHVGDRVRDPLDGEWREVMSIDPCGTVNMRDGGVTGLAECERAEKRLPSESLD